MATEVVPGFELTGRGWLLRSCPVPHAQPEPACMALRVETERAAFAYSGDAALCAGLEALAERADLLLHWCYRLDGDERDPYVTRMSPDFVQIAQLATRCRVERLLLTHLRPSMDDAASWNA